MTTRPIVPEDANGKRIEASQRRSLYRAISGHALADLTKRRTAEQVVPESWPNDRDANPATSAASSPLSTSSGFGLLTAVSSWPLLAPSSAAARLFQHPSVLSLDFAGVYQYSVPHVATPPLPIFVGEGQPIPVVNMAYSGT